MKKEMTNSTKASILGKRIAKFQISNIGGFVNKKRFCDYVKGIAENLCAANFPDKTKNIFVLERICGEAAYKEANKMFFNKK
jgi:hypothetical protein